MKKYHININVGDMIFEKKYPKMFLIVLEIIERVNSYGFVTFKAYNTYHKIIHKYDMCFSKKTWRVI